MRKRQVFLKVMQNILKAINVSFVIFKRTCLNYSVLVLSNPNSVMNLIQFSVTPAVGVGLFKSQCYCSNSVSGLQALGLLLERSRVEE